MKRREFIALIGASAAAAPSFLWPRAARAQQTDRVRRIGVFMNSAADDPEGQARNTAFVQALQQLGWTDGRNARIDTRWGTDYYDRIGLSEACFSGARGRCRGSDGSAQAASACAGSGVLQSTAALSGWPGGVRDGALLGAGVARAWPRGATDAGAIRESLRQAQ